jgi:hypothetical protein
VYSKSVEEGKQRLVADILEDAMGEKSVATCRQMVNEKTPRFIKDSIINQARRRLREDKPLNWNFSEHFDFDDNEVQQLFEQLIMALLMSVKFSRSEVRKCISTSINFNFDLLVRPMETLEKGFFATNEIVKRDRIIRQLEKLNCDSESLKHLAMTISKSEREEVDRRAFKLLAKQTIETVFDGQNKDIVINDFKKVIDFFFFRKEHITPKEVDSAVMKEFLLARRMDKAINIFEKKEQQGKRFWRIEDIPDLYLPLSIPEKYGVVPEETSISISKIEKKKPRPKIIFSSQEERVTVERKNIERQPPGPYPALESIISNKEQKIFVKRIFNNDCDAYIKFIEILDGTQRWKKAKQIIDMELERRDIDAYSKEALTLGDRVFSKFFASMR